MDNVVESESFKLDKLKWQLVALGKLAEEISVRVEEPFKSGYDRFIGLQHFESGSLKIKSYGTTENLTSSTKAFKKGDVLLARRNAYLRRASLVDFDGVCSGDAFVLRENSEYIIPGFLAFIVNSNKMWDFANANAAGTMSKRVKWRDLSQFELLLPPKEEQVKILDLWWKAYSFIEHQLVVNERTISLKESVFENFITDNNEPVTKSTIGELACKEKYSCIGGPFGSNLSGKHYVEEPGVPVIRGTNLSKGKFEFIDDGFVYVSTEKADSLVKNMAYRGDIVVTQRGTMGQVGLIPFDSKYERYVISQSQMKITVDSKKALPKYVYYYLLSRSAMHHLSLSIISTGIPHINLGIFRSFPILLPSIESQEKVVKKIEVIDSCLRDQRAQLTSSINLLNNLINKVF